MSLFCSYLEDSFARGCPVCKTAEEELRQLQANVREEGQVPHDIRRETLKNQRHQNKSVKHLKLSILDEYHKQGFPIILKRCYSRLPSIVYVLLNVLFVWKS